MKKVLILDESGTIDSNPDSERYFVFGGIMYNLDDFEYIKSRIIPTFKLFTEILEVEELKSSKLTNKKSTHNLIYGSVLNHINSIEEIQPIIYVLDKSSSYIIKSYDKKSFKYNKLIKFMILDLIHDKFIDENDTLWILLDQIDLNKKERDNLSQWLPLNVKQVEKVELGNSKEYWFLQATDLIAGIPKLKGNTSRQIKSDPKLRILSRCYTHVFPLSKTDEILLDIKKNSENNNN